MPPPATPPAHGLPPLAAATAVPPARGPATVLVADDSATLRLLVRVELESAGHRVVEAEDGAAALEAVRAQPVDVVLLDVEMPVLDGWAVLDQLVAEHGETAPPVVFLTGLTATEDLVRALRRGAHDFVRKPPDAAELLARVASAARVKQLQDALVARAAQLDDQGRTDVLTGLRNRRHAEEHLRAAASLARRHQHPLAVALLDVDRFKAVNDEHGHATGDAVLRAVAEALEGSARTEDLVARWGGEEFVVVPAPPPEVDGGRAMVERLRAAVARVETATQDGRQVQVTLSGGLALGVPAEGTDDAHAVERLLHAADEALYAAKRGGRDRVATVELPAL